MKKNLYDIWIRFRRLTVNRKYKDRLFRLIFQEKQALLTLYNAVNDTNYTNADELVITTIQDAIYMGMKNDGAFLIDCQMNLYEHQSSWNPNMPLRGLLYFSEMLRAYVEKKQLNLYSSTKITLPLPQYLVFYNGTEKEEDRMELNLSDSFFSRGGEAPSLECRAILLNINKGHNQELMEKCKPLADYAYFVQTVRDNLAHGYPLEIATEMAVDECIEKDIMADILIQNRGEVLNMLLTTYDRKLHEKTLQKEARAEGHAEGHALGLAEGKKLGLSMGIQALIETCLELGLSREDTLLKIKEKFTLSSEEANTYLKQYLEKNKIRRNKSHR